MSKLQLMTRSVSTLVRILEFLIAALVLGIFSYYLAFLHQHNLDIPNWQKAVEGMSGAAVIYTAFAVALTFFLGGITFFALIAVILDVCFCGCFIAIAVLARAGAHSCGSVDDSPIGTGQHTSCQLQRAAFAVAIVAAYVKRRSSSSPPIQTLTFTSDSYSCSPLPSKSSSPATTRKRNVTAPPQATTTPPAQASALFGPAKTARTVTLSSPPRAQLPPVVSSPLRESVSTTTMTESTAGCTTRL